MPRTAPPKLQLFVVMLTSALACSCQQTSTSDPSRRASGQAPASRVRTDFELRLEAMALASYPVAWDQERFIELKEIHRSKRITALIPAGKTALVELPFADGRAFQLLLDNLREVGGKLRVDRAVARINWSANGVGPTQWRLTAAQLFESREPVAVEDSSGRSGQRVELKIERWELVEYGGAPGGVQRARLLKQRELDNGSWRSSGGAVRVRRPVRVLQSVVARGP